MAVRVSKEDFEAVVLKSELPVLVDFYSDSCIACKKLAPVLGDIEDDYEDRLKVVKLNTNFDGDIAAEYSVMANPTVVLFKGGESIAKKTGAATKKELEDWLLEKL